MEFSSYCRESEGRREYFYPNGMIKTIDSCLQGESILYWPNGKLKRKCQFLNGVRHGLDAMWSEEGVLLDEGKYESGKPVGFHRRFSKTGAMIEEIEYLDTSRFNLREWDDHGVLRVEAIWIDLVNYQERIWDRFQQIWVEKKGFWDGKKLVYL